MVATAKNINAISPFVYFVTNEQLISDAIQSNKDPNAPETQATFMHLLKLEGLLKMTGTSEDVNDVLLVEHCLLDTNHNAGFLQFPFSDTGL